jgi:hypothetical protein
LALVRGLIDPAARKDPDWHFVLCVLVGSVPIGIVGLAAKSLIEGPLRSLWVVGTALVTWSAAMIVAERRATQARGEAETTFKDALVIGSMQCLALFPGVSRSGATISAGLFRGLDRVAALRRLERRRRDGDGRRHGGRVRRRLRLDRVAAAVRRGPQHRSVRAVPGGGRPERAVRDDCPRRHQRLIN